MTNQHNPDIGLTEDELEEKYNPGDDGGEHPQYTVDIWLDEVRDQNTSSPYWEWVRDMLSTE